MQGLGKFPKLLPLHIHQLVLILRMPLIHLMSLPQDMHLRVPLVQASRIHLWVLIAQASLRTHPLCLRDQASHILPLALPAQASRIHLLVLMHQASRIPLLVHQARWHHSSPSTLIHLLKYRTDPVAPHLHTDPVDLSLLTIQLDLHLALRLLRCQMDHKWDLRLSILPILPAL